MANDTVERFSFEARLECHYLLDAPEEVDERTLLVLALHGYGWNPEVMLRLTKTMLGTGHAICSVDVRGAFAVLCYRRVRSGISVDELEMDAPPIAIPVLRGVTRVAPGMSLPSPAPIAIRVDDAGAPLEAVAAPAAPAPTVEALASARLRIRWDATTRRAEIVR